MRLSRFIGALLLPAFYAAGQPIGPEAQRQIAALLAEKAARTPAQQKMDSHLVHAAKILRGEPVHPDFPKPPGEIEAVRLDARNYVELDITADVTPDLLAFIRALGGEVLNSFAEYRAIRARVPLPAVERLAGRAEVQAIRVADPGHSNARGGLEARLKALLAGPRARRPLSSRLGASFFVGPDNTGDIAHQANLVRSGKGYDGTGITIGILSDGTNSLATEQKAGRLPAVTVIQTASGDEGTALLEIAYTLAPGARLMFATATGGQANMANNIQALANAGCQIIIDDWTYFAEGVFQDDIVSRKVNAVSGAGIFYFTDAQNSGSVLKSNSGTWEGDFSDSGTSIPAITAREATGSAIHNFGTAANPVNADTLTRLSQPSFNDYELKWSDPLLGSSNDYDLFVLDPTMSTVLASSTNVQNGTQNPEESIYESTTLVIGSRIVIVKHPSAAVRALHLDTERGVVTVGTTGATFGHNAAAGAFTMAAADVQYAAGGAFTGGSANPSYAASSDGPRRMFYNPDGTAITPGNLTFGTNGGLVLNKPDFTAADGVPTGVSGYTTFYGTSAAGPHAGAIAAMVLEEAPGISVAQMRAALTASALDIDAPGWDINSGAGIVMAPGAVTAAGLGLPGVGIGISHTGDFAQGQLGAAYTVSVGVTGGVSLAGTAVVTATLPPGLTLDSMSGSGWSCSGTACSRADGLAAGSTFPAISLLVNVAGDAPSSLSSQVSIAVGGLTVGFASDPTIIVAPGPPALSAPPNGATGVAFTPVLSWTASAGASSYDVYFGTSSTPPLLTNTTATSVAAGNLTSTTTYYWYVAARLASGSSLPSATWSFTTAVALKPTINSGGVVPIYSPVNTIEPGSWVSIYGTNLAPAAATWNGDYPISLGGVSVTVNGKAAYLWYVSPSQINMEAPDDTAAGPVTVVVTGPGGTAAATVSLGPVGPCFNLFSDDKHVAGVILTSGTGAYGNGTYDLVGPTGAFPFATRPVKRGETLLLYGTGFGPSNPPVPAGQPYTGTAAATVNPPGITIGGVAVTAPYFLYSLVVAPGVYQIAVTVPPNVASGDQLLMADLSGFLTPAGVLLTVQ